MFLSTILAEVTKYIASTLAIPVYSIGAGPYCDGQLLIVSDLIGQFQAFTPKFVKKYCNVADMITNAMKAYCEEVRSGAFPDDKKYCYPMIEGEEQKFLEIIKKNPDWFRVVVTDCHNERCKRNA